MTLQEGFRFGEFEWLPALRQLRRSGEPVRLGGRAFDLLSHLLKNRDRVVSKSELMDAVWGQTVVVENNLNGQITAIRKVLGHDSLVNVSGRGYRFAFDVLPLETLQERTNAPLPTTASIAVMPFENLSGDEGQLYLADGVAEEIRSALANFRQLRVLSRHATFSARGRALDVQQAGRAFGAGYVLGGSVQRSAERLRITARLHSAVDAVQLWSDRFEGGLDEVFEMQDRIAAQVAAAVEPAVRKEEIELARRSRPNSLPAYDLYLRALPLVTAFENSANKVALGLLNEAIAIDSTYAPALAHAAWCHEQRLSRQWPGADETLRAEAVDLAWRALGAAENDARCIALAGFVLFTTGRIHDDGLEAMRRAVALNPNDVSVLNFAGTANLFMGDLDTAQHYLERGMQLNQSTADAFMFMTALAGVHFLRSEHEQALALASKSAAMNPNWDFTWCVLAAAACELGDGARARQALENVIRFTPNPNLEGLKVFINPSHRAAFEHALHKASLPAAGRA